MLEGLVQNETPLLQKSTFCFTTGSCVSPAPSSPCQCTAQTCLQSTPKLGMYIYCDLAVSGLHNSKVRMSGTMALVVPWGNNTPVKLCRKTF